MRSMTNTVPLPRLLTYQEIMDRWDVCESTVRRRLRKVQKTYISDRTVRVPEKLLLRYETERTVVKETRQLKPTGRSASTGRPRTA